MIVTFQNKGILDVRAITTFGVNVKESDNPIGYFGTGLKYAIAVLLREGHSIQIYAGDDDYEFHTQTEEIRGKQFDMVYMNDRQLGFTLELGKNWDVWQAFRELYCNMKDEGGEVFPRAEPHKDGHTTIHVIGHKFFEVYQNRHEFFLETPPDVSLPGVAIHYKSSPHIFYRGIRATTPDYPPRFTYNIISGVNLTEDRTISSLYSVSRVIGDAICNYCDDPDLIRTIVIASSETLESKIDFDMPFYTPSKVFLDVVEEHRLNPDMNRSALAVLRRCRKPKKIPAMNLNDIQAKQLQKAVDFCNRIGYRVDKYTITVSEELNRGLMGLAQRNEKHIYLSPDNFHQGTKYLAATLIEEFLHIETGLADCTYDFQNRIFQELVTLGELIIGEPL